MRLVIRSACAIALALAVTSLATASFAQGGLSNSVCREDVDRLCADVKGTRGAVAECLRSKSAELDPDCRQELEERKARLAERLAIAESACQPELEKFCAGEPEIAKVPCLRKQHANLSDGCRAVIPPRKSAQ